MQQLICHQTGESYPLDSPIWRSESGGILDIEFDGAFDPMEILTRPPGLWRYHEALPISNPEDRITLGEVLTPIVRLVDGKHTIETKLDYLFPSGSYKDRGATLLMSQARALGIESVVQDSSGNAGAAIATYAAVAGIECEIFVPDSTSPAKLDQMRACGATLTLVPGSREDTANAAFLAAKDRYYASHVWNPFFLQGTKTFAFEIAEQRGWILPDTLVLPAGNGTLLLGAWIGFVELKQMGIVNKIPKLIGVQAANCAPLVEAWRRSSAEPISVATSSTVAEGIAIAEPRRGAQMILAVKQSGGHMIEVEEEEIIDSLRWLCAKGLFVEPTSAAVMAGARQYVSTAPADEEVLTVLTGHGLKAASKIQSLVSKK